MFACIHANLVTTAAVQLRCVESFFSKHVRSVKREADKAHTAEIQFARYFFPSLRQVFIPRLCILCLPN